MEIPTCPACGGAGAIAVHIQRRMRGHRVCHEETQECPVCRGSKHAVQEQLDAWLSSMVPYHEHIGQEALE